MRVGETWGLARAGYSLGVGSWMFAEGSGLVVGVPHVALQVQGLLWNPPRPSPRPFVEEGSRVRSLPGACRGGWLSGMDEGHLPGSSSWGGSWVGFPGFLTELTPDPSSRVPGPQLTSVLSEDLDLAPWAPV